MFFIVGLCTDVSDHIFKEKKIISMSLSCVFWIKYVEFLYLYIAHYVNPFNVEHGCCSY